MNPANPSSSAKATLEKELDKLGYLYVLVQRLHGSLSLSEVMSATNEALINLVGSEDFALYVRDASGQKFDKVMEVGPSAKGMPSFRSGEGPLGLALAAGEIQLGESPVAAVPLYGSGTGRRCVGLIAVFSLLQHKKGLTERDQELLHTLSTNAGVALEAAYFATEAEAECVSASRLMELLSDRGSA